MLTDCTLTNNSVQGANDGNGGTSCGGAICILGGSLNLTNCWITGNQAVGGAVPYGQVRTALGQAKGGAIYSAGTEILLQGSVLNNNAATGGVPSQSVPGLSFWGPGGNGLGGALFVSNSTVTMISCLVQGNSALGGSPTSPNLPSGPGSGDGDGGGLFVCKDSVCAISGSTFHGNAAVGGPGARNYSAGSGYGGDVLSDGRFQVQESTFSHSHTMGGDSLMAPGVAQGGAIHSSGVLSINGCTFVDSVATGGNSLLLSNQPWPGGAAEGGALWSSGLLNCTNSTISTSRVLGGRGGGSLAPGPGGVGAGGGAYLTNATAALANITVAANRADGANIYSDGGGPALGGNLAVTNSAVTILNSIIAHSGNGANVWGIIADAGHNISSDGSAGFSVAGSLNNTDPKLGPLGDYGGRTATMPLLAGSPAIDGGGQSGAPFTDQRGRIRPSGSTIDIGAFESSPPYVMVGHVYGLALDDEVSVSTPAETTTTTNHGLFRIDGLASGTYSLSATHSNYVFVPSSQSVIVGPDRLDLSFEAFRLLALSPQPNTNALNHLVLAATPGTIWRILASTNTHDWIVVSTNAVGLNGILDCFLPISPEQSRFYRAVTP